MFIVHNGEIVNYSLEYIDDIMAREASFTLPIGAVVYGDWDTAIRAINYEI